MIDILSKSLTVLLLEETVVLKLLFVITYWEEEIVSR